MWTSHLQGVTGGCRQGGQQIGPPISNKRVLGDGKGGERVRTEACASGEQHLGACAETAGGREEEGGGAQAHANRES